MSERIAEGCSLTLGNKGRVFRRRPFGDQVDINRQVSKVTRWGGVSTERTQAQGSCRNPGPLPQWATHRSEAKERERARKRSD
jgi:hypothetical protein